MAQQDTTSVEQLLDRNIEALNAQDIEGVLANQQPDAELVIPGGVTLHGHDQLRQYTEALWAAFPDGAFSFAGRVVAGDAAGVELVFTGTHTGPLTTPTGVIPSTGKRVTLYSASILRFRDGLIASEHAYLDQLEFMTQLGLMPPAPGADRGGGI
jgi:predicted ester cyclase